MNNQRRQLVQAVIAAIALPSTAVAAVAPKQLGPWQQVPKVTRENLSDFAEPVHRVIIERLEAIRPELQRASIEEAQEMVKLVVNDLKLSEIRVFPSTLTQKQDITLMYYMGDEVWETNVTHETYSAEVAAANLKAFKESSFYKEFYGV